MDTSLFHYDLPPNLIAERSVEPRDHARMLVVDRTGDRLEDRFIFDLPALLKPGDLLVFNDSKVFRARLRTTHGQHPHELFLLHPHSAELGQWHALLGHSRRLREGDTLTLADGTSVHLVQKIEHDGTWLVDFTRSHEHVFEHCERYGEIPTPPYVPKRDLTDDEYQTVYAKHTGSVAAPTAGFHFTNTLLAALVAMNVQRAFVTLHVGLGTFRPIKAEQLNSHPMHAEWTHVSSEAAEAIAATKARGGRVIAVGTTTVRALETFAGQAGEGWTNLFITPGYHFKVIDGLLTNFHLPKSTLLVLVSALAGRERIMTGYKHAIAQKYRFYSFGDAMLII